MAKYPRILVRYRLPNSDQWSDLHWCDIQRTGEGDATNIEVRIAQATREGVMPADNQFTLLDSESAKKLLVVDITETARNPRIVLADTKGADLLYCLTIVNNMMYRFVFHPQSRLFTSSGTSWKDAGSFNLGICLPLGGVFTGEDIAADARLVMRTDKTEHYNLLQYSSPLLSDFTNQLSAWYLEQTTIQQQGILAEEQLRQRARESGEQQMRAREAEAAELRQWHTQPVDIDASFVNSSIDDLDRLILHAPICEALFHIKSLTNNPAHYQEILFHLVSQTPISDSSSADLKDEIISFQTRFLRNSYDLNELFQSSESRHPTLATVHHYVLDVVLLELQNYDESYYAEDSQPFKAVCPRSYTEIQLGVTQRTRLIDVDGPVDFNADARLAAQLQMQDANEGDDMLAIALQLRNQVRARRGLPPLDGINSQSTPIETPARRNFPRDMSRYNARLGLFAHLCGIQPPFRLELNDQTRRLVMLILGGTLCVVGTCIAFYALAAGLSLIAGGIGCLVAATLLTPRSQDNAPPTAYLVM